MRDPPCTRQVTPEPIQGHPKGWSEGLPERDISSLGVMGWGLEVAGKFFRRRPGGSSVGPSRLSLLAADLSHAPSTLHRETAP